MRLIELKTYVNLFSHLDTKILSFFPYNITVRRQDKNLKVN